MIDMWDVERLGDAHYASRDPQFDDGMFRCALCGSRFEYDEMFWDGETPYCMECAEDIGLLEGDEDDD